MKKLSLITIVVAVFMLTAFKPITNKLITKDAHISFYSHTAIEDITANNFKVVSTLDIVTGDVVFSVPMQSFEFEKALMQKHFNSKKFLDTKQFPKAKFIGKIDDLNSVDFSNDGEYLVTISGSLTIKGETKPISEQAKLTVENGDVTLDSTMNIILGDYGISFSKGKPSKNIAKEIEVNIKAIYRSE